MDDLKAYESERREANGAALRQAHEVFMRLTGPQLRHRLLRPLFFWMMANIPAVPRRLFRQMVALGTSPSKRGSD